MTLPRSAISGSQPEDNYLVFKLTAKRDLLSEKIDMLHTCKKTTNFGVTSS